MARPPFRGPRPTPLLRVYPKVCTSVVDKDWYTVGLGACAERKAIIDTGASMTLISRDLVPSDTPLFRCPPGGGGMVGACDLPIEVVGHVRLFVQDAVPGCRPLGHWAAVTRKPLGEDLDGILGLNWIHGTDLVMRPKNLEAGKGPRAWCARRRRPRGA